MFFWRIFSSQQCTRVYTEYPVTHIYMYTYFFWEERERRQQLRVPSRIARRWVERFSTCDLGPFGVCQVGYHKNYIRNSNNYTDWSIPELPGIENSLWSLMKSSLPERQRAQETQISRGRVNNYFVLVLDQLSAMLTSLLLQRQNPHSLRWRQSIVSISKMAREGERRERDRWGGWQRRVRNIKQNST